MQFKFKIQPYQTEAARAVTDVFAGQPNIGASLYLRDLGRTVGSAVIALWSLRVWQRVLLL